MAGFWAQKWGRVHDPFCPSLSSSPFPYPPTLPPSTHQVDLVLVVQHLRRRDPCGAGGAVRPPTYPSFAVSSPPPSTSSSHTRSHRRRFPFGTTHTFSRKRFRPLDPTSAHHNHSARRKLRRSKSPAGLGSAERLMEVTIDVRWTGGGCDQHMMRWCSLSR